MSYRRIVNSYYSDINNLVDLLNKIVNSYRLLIGGADELNKIALASKSDIKDAMDRAEDLGAIIDEIIKTLDKVCCNYVNYCKIKSDVIKSRLQAQSILIEIEEELKLKE